MPKLVLVLVLAVIVWRTLIGRWPWQKKPSVDDASLRKARALLVVDRKATRADIIAAHRRLLTAVHPDKGGSSEQVHEADRARDLLLGELPKDQLPND